MGWGENGGRRLGGREGEVREGWETQEEGEGTSR